MTSRVLLVSTHPVQYAVPLFRLYQADCRIETTVAYCSLQGAQPGVDPEFGLHVAWDVPLLDGYTWSHPANRSPRPRVDKFLGLINPGVWRIVRRGDFDIVVCYGYRAASFWIAAFAAKLSGARVVFSTDAHTIRPRDGAIWKIPLKRLLLPLIFRWADAVLAPSTRTVAFLGSLGVPRKNVFLTPYVVDTDFFREGARYVDRRGLRSEWGIPEDAAVALFVGKLVPWKRPADLLEAAARVKGLRVVFAGDGSLRADLQSRASLPDLRGRVKFLGFVNQQALPQVYAASDILVLTSEYEAFGLAVNEAFACGLPAVVSEACGAAGDLVREGETGHVVPVGDIDALANRLRNLARDRDLRSAMGERARARISEWSLAQNLDGFVEACRVLTRHSPAK